MDNLVMSPPYIPLTMPPTMLRATCLPNLRVTKESIVSSDHKPLG